VVREEQVEVAVGVLEQLPAAAAVAEDVERAGGRRVEDRGVVLVGRDRLDEVEGLRLARRICCGKGAWGRIRSERVAKLP
jgi:hypothetical protein